MNKNDALQYIASRSDYFSSLSDEIWDHPEVRFTEKVSSDILCHAFEEEGFQVQRGLAELPTSFVARYGGGKPCIGFLGEFDALPGLSQRSGIAECIPQEPNANGHGCGHNLLGVGSLAAAFGLKKYLEKNHLHGTVVYFGCPAEEGGSGKTFMARAHCFDELDCAITWHPGSVNGVPSGSFLANYQVKYQFTGIASHAAAAPQMGRSALDALELMNMGVQFLREHVIQDARIHYAITDTGGDSPNIVQPRATAIYLIRAPKTSQVEEICQRVNHIAQGAAIMTDTKVNIRMMKGCSNTVPNVSMDRIMYRNLLEIPRPACPNSEKALVDALAATLKPQGAIVRHQVSNLPEYIISAKQKQEILDRADEKIQTFVLPYVPSDAPIPASSDVGDVSWICPTSQIATATWVAGTVNHTWQAVTSGKTEFAHRSTLYAAQVMMGTAIDLYNNPEQLKTAQQELDCYLDGTPYHNPMPDDIHPSDLYNQ